MIRIKNRTRLIGLGTLFIVAVGLSSLVNTVPAGWVSPDPPATPPEPIPEPSLVQLELLEQTEPADLVIHEWGTFLGMSGSDGTILDGMYHEEHALPSFVHARSRDQLRLPEVFLKGETPVIYFYTQQPLSVRLGVRFPQGVWTQWYPQAARVLPPLVQQAESHHRLKDGRICWNVKLIPPALAESLRKSKAVDVPEPPSTSAEALWNFARDVDAAYVECLDGAQAPARKEYERFLFYRGLGEARMPLSLSAGGGGTLKVDQAPTISEGIRHVFVIRVEKGRAAFRYLSIVHPGQSVAGVIPDLNDAQSTDDFTRTITGLLAGRLEESGLYAKEARAMVDTWKSSYFQTDGIRILFILPQSWTDAFIPMDVTPRPKQVVRVMVGRLELLSPAREQLAEAAIRNLSSAEPDLRNEAFAYLREQGRYVEPIIRRVLRTSHDDAVRTNCTRLLETEFVTELRAAVHAATGNRLTVEPLLLRAHLARLLREIGQDQEARAEGLAILGELQKPASLTGKNQENQAGRQEMRAAALEATGVDRSAALVYEERIREFVNSVGGRFNSTALPWYRDWWVGRGYGKSVVRSGEARQVAQKLESRLEGHESSRTDAELLCSRLLLAYLHEARGAQAEADRVWAALGGAVQPPRDSTREPGRTAAR